MKPKLALSLTGANLVLELQRPAAAGGVPSLLRSLLAIGRPRSNSAAHEVTARVELAEYCTGQAYRVTSYWVIDQLAWHGLLLRVQLAEQADEDRHG